jgi:phosphopantothenoylcysteine decarboxylase/phosphopantothenate--cysteine ligase
MDLKIRNGQLKRLSRQDCCALKLKLFLKKLATKKRILITAGPTWVAVDQARVISNLAPGETGFLLAERFKKLGAQVTLLLGPGNFSKTVTGIKLVHFNYFSQLAGLLNQELKSKRYSAVIHAAAVADYQPKITSCGKVSSLRKSWRLDLVPTPKLINRLKNYQPNLFTVGFKFEPQADKIKLIKKGRVLLKTAGLNLVVANSNKHKGYQAYILNQARIFGPFLTKAKMSAALVKLIR